MPRRNHHLKRSSLPPRLPHDSAKTTRRRFISILLICLAILLVAMVNVMWPSLEKLLQPSPARTSLRHLPAPEADDPPAVSRANPVAVELAPSTTSRQTHAAAIEALAEKRDARQDLWRTEVLAEQVVERMSTLIDGSADTFTSGSLYALVDEDFACEELRPGKLVEVYRDAHILVRRGHTSRADGGSVHRGVRGFQTAMRQLMELGDFGRITNTKFKLFRVQQETELFTTWIRYEGRGRASGRSLQQTAVWICRWSSPQDKAPQLLRIDLESYEESESQLSAGTLFVDCTAAAIGDDRSYEQQVLPGINHWLAGIPREFMPQFGHNGIAVGDVNSDGLDDIYVCDAGGLPNRLYVQRTDGTAHDIAADAGVDFLDDSSGALLLDLDNDGDQDLVVASDPLLQIAENDGRGRFQLCEPLQLNTDALSLSSADFDVDGDLDIYVCGYNLRTMEPTNRGLPFPLPYHDARNGGRNVLLRNEGRLRFVDATRDVGLEVGNSRFSMAASWEDFDNDGDQDLYVANDFGPNNLFRNDEGRFTDIAAKAGVEDHAAGMSVSWGDYNRDGRMDLYVGNMFSAAGNRVTYQRRFAEGKTARTVSLLRRMARGNTLFAAVDRDGSAEFQDVSLQEAVDMGRWAWSSKFTDFTNDGWPDLIVANGYVTGSDTSDL